MIPSTLYNPVDIVVVGDGHAGCEAALAAARMGCTVALVSCRPDTAARMPCNPAIGGLGKGHLVREVDALGGEMGLCGDRTGIQFRRLNMRKGAAVRATRVQSDKAALQPRDGGDPSLDRGGLPTGVGEVVERAGQGARGPGVALAGGERIACRAAHPDHRDLPRRRDSRGLEYTPGGGRRVSPRLRPVPLPARRWGSSWAA